MPWLCTALAGKKAALLLCRALLLHVTSAPPPSCRYSVKISKDSSSSNSSAISRHTSSFSYVIHKQHAAGCTNHKQATAQSKQCAAKFTPRRTCHNNMFQPSMHAIWVAKHQDGSNPKQAVAARHLSATAMLDTPPLSPLPPPQQPPPMPLSTLPASALQAYHRPQQHRPPKQTTAVTTHLCRLCRCRRGLPRTQQQPYLQSPLPPCCLHAQALQHDLSNRKFQIRSLPPLHNNLQQHCPPQAEAQPYSSPLSRLPPPPRPPPLPPSPLPPSALQPCPV
jgi:hypothetical protein